MTKEPDEDLIEATIRRVAEAKAARAASDPVQDGAAASETPQGAPIAEAAPVAPTIAAPGAPEDPPPVADERALAAPPAAAEADDDRIAATIRRVAEAKAARAAESPQAVAVDAEAMPPGASPPLPQQAARAAESPQTAAVDAEAMTPGASRPPSQRKAMPVRRPEPAAADRPQDDRQAWLAEIDEVRRELAATRRELRALSERFEAALSQIGSRREPHAATNQDDWDDTPQIPRIPLGQAPRPPIFRDPSPRTATAERLEPEPETIIDTRPLPKPLPPLHAEPKRGLDLLPRTYRITVEDKRRGVDLVPLHRALLGMDGVRDMSLLSYSNGVAIVAVEMIDELEPQALESAIGRAMSRNAKAEVHNDTTMVVRLAEE